MATRQVRAASGRVLAAEQDEELGPLSNWIRPRFSPDGRQVTFGTQAGDIWVAATDGSGKKKLATVEIIEFEGRRRVTTAKAWESSSRM